MEYKATNCTESAKHAEVSRGTSAELAERAFVSECTATECTKRTGCLEYKFDEFAIRDNKYFLQMVYKKELSKIYHSHNFYEVMIVLKGSVVQNINSVEYKMNEGDGVLLLPGDRHSFIWQSKQTEILGLSVEKEEFEKFYDAFCTLDKKDEEFIIFSCKPELNAMRSMGTKFCNKSDNFNDCKLLLSFVLHNIFDFGESEREEIPERLRNVVEKMSEPDNIRDGMDALLRLSNYSYPHIYRLFKEHYNQTPHEFIANLKLESAYSQILFSDLSIENIMQNVGYTSLSNFHTAFKKKYGTSPGQLRHSNSLRNTF